MVITVAPFQAVNHMGVIWWLYMFSGYCCHRNKPDTQFWVLFMMHWTEAGAFAAKKISYMEIHPKRFRATCQWFSARNKCFVDTHPNLAHNPKCMAQVHLGRVQIHFSLTVEEMLPVPGAGFKMVVLSLLINEGCDLGIACNKPISVASLFSIKSQVCVYLL